jgi:hypothetical protein
MSRVKVRAVRVKRVADEGYDRAPTFHRGVWEVRVALDEKELRGVMEMASESGYKGDGAGGKFLRDLFLSDLVPESLGEQEFSPKGYAVRRMPAGTSIRDHVRKHEVRMMLEDGSMKMLNGLSKLAGIPSAEYLRGLVILAMKNSGRGGG